MLTSPPAENNAISISLSNDSSVNSSTLYSLPLKVSSVPADFSDENKYRLFNLSNYNELFDKENNTITWYSDETNHEVANILKIRKESKSFELEFYIQPYIEGYDRDFNSLYHIPIRFRNSGSSYDPFNIVFMRMYEKMKQVYDINDYGHQIHIEEYLYNQNKIKKLTK